MSLPLPDVRIYTKKLKAIEAAMAEAREADSITRLAREHAQIKPRAELAAKIAALQQDMEEAEALLDDSDEAMAALAKEEYESKKKELATQMRHFRLALLPKDKADDSSVILEVRAGTGGEEAAIFAGDLFRMYQRYAAQQRWRLEILSASETDRGGYREIQAAIKGAAAYSRLKFESGVHRVQRVPVTETQGRVHTSAASIAILPEPEDVDIVIAPEDLRIDVFRSSGPGGQSVNTTDSAVRIKHLPTGITVSQQDEKSQHKNRAKAMKILRARLYERERAIADAQRAESRKSQIGSGDRSDRIRTYNYPQGRVSDHRIDLTLYKLERIISGELLDELIDPLIEAHQNELLGQLWESD